MKAALSHVSGRESRQGFERVVPKRPSSARLVSTMDRRKGSGGTETENFPMNTGSLVDHQNGCHTVNSRESNDIVVNPTSFLTSINLVDSHIDQDS